MPHYSVAATKDNLSRLIDKALAGEEVVITRHGKPTVELRVVPSKPQDAEAAWERLNRQRKARGPVGITAVELLRLQDEDERY